MQQIDDNNRAMNSSLYFRALILKKVIIGLIVIGTFEFDGALIS